MALRLGPLRARPRRSRPTAACCSLLCSAPPPLPPPLTHTHAARWRSRRTSQTHAQQTRRTAAALQASSSLTDESPALDARLCCAVALCSDYLFKLVLIGDSGVGKSCLLLRFAVRHEAQQPERSSRRILSERSAAQPPPHELADRQIPQESMSEPIEYTHGRPFALLIGPRFASDRAADRDSPCCWPAAGCRCGARCAGRQLHRFLHQHHRSGFRQDEAHTSERKASWTGEQQSSAILMPMLVLLLCLSPSAIPHDHDRQEDRQAADLGQQNGRWRVRVARAVSFDRVRIILTRLSSRCALLVVRRIPPVKSDFAPSLPPTIAAPTASSWCTT